MGRRKVPPLALVWTPIPVISWVLPFVGHMGITDSAGQLHDWHGACAPSAAPPEEMLFGQPARYLELAGGARRDDWDRAIERADEEFGEKCHCMLFGDDCHSHVARALNIVRYMGCAFHNKVALALAVFFLGKHVSLADALRVWLPPTILLSIALAIHFSGGGGGGGP
mmetsp:Transcript_37567/g.120511  ORF Transcript_37567/g.120511 Transcript_37567/m.120511 type:complete len:168 (+) Transcript_37567:92-595(+)